MEITLKEFMQNQPNYPEVADSDKYFTAVACHLAKVWENSRIFANISDDIKKRVILGVLGYFQDILADAGIWRSFSTLCNELYGTPVPFFDRPDDYIDSELNPIDVQFMIWYLLETSSSENGHLSPYDSRIIELTKKLYSVLDAIYEDAPNPTELNMMLDVELHNEEPDNMRQLYDLSSWLFWNSYFMRPAAAPTLEHSMIEAKEIIKQHPDQDEARPFLAELNQRIMVENPTGPLSLSIGEWLELILEQKFPEIEAETEQLSEDKQHKFYKALIKATGGSPIAFFPTYKELNSFLSNEMGWGENPEGHISALSSCSNFVILGNQEKGILIAHDVAQYIKHPNNTTYNKDEAEKEGHRLITQYGIAPIDLTKYLFRNGLVPDIKMPFENADKQDFIHKHWDFLARLYQQTYYRGD